MTKKTANLWVLVALILIFVLPLVAAWVFVVRGDWPFGRVNHGVLFDKPLDFTRLDLKTVDGRPVLWKNSSRQWWVAVIEPLPCDDTCQTTLYQLQQLQVALSQHQDAVKPVMLAISRGSTARVRIPIYYVSGDELGRGVPMALKPGSLLILDPHHRAILGYRELGTGDDILADLKRLMRAQDLGQGAA